ncbi:hypothetical protein RND81_08G156300 [Saponaria officinalis]|uniref:Glutaredoxin domain-containing protein n=1 Tax=Saponaria officinalis TaxID=3572 RepID=A0AAW1J9E6_SAPOF
MATTNVNILRATLSSIQPPHPRHYSLSPRRLPSFSLFSSSSSSLSLKLTSLSPFKPLPKPRSLSTVSAAVPKLADSVSFPLSPENDAIGEELTSSAGVYAVFDTKGDLQFIGLSRNVAASVDVHRKKVPELCSFVKVGVIDEPDRESLTQAWKSWMEEHIEATGKIPPGNETGNTTIFRPPPQKKSDLRLTPGRQTQLTVPLEELIDKLVKENKVVAFIKGSRNAPQCGFSQRVVGILNSQGVDYESVDVLDDEYNNGLRETLKNYSNWPTFPQVFVNGELVGGCDILTSMHEKGELASLFNE